MKKKVVVIGGGNGSAIALVALKRYAELFDISAVISMSDSTGSSGRLRDELGALPPGDIMRSVLALSRYNYRLLKKIFYTTRFEGAEKLGGHNIGNLFLSLSASHGGNFMDAVKAFGQGLAVVGQSYPSTLDSTDLVAELSNGEIVRTEGSIDRPKYDRSLKIKRLWLEPEGKAYPEAVRSITEADWILLSPGDLYTSVVAALLPKGIREAIDKSKARLIYIAGNARHEDGATGPETLSGFVAALENYLPRPIDTILYCDHKQTEAEKEFYARKKWKIFPFDVENLPGRDVRGCDFERDGGGLSSVKLGRLLKEMIENDQT